MYYLNKKLLEKIDNIFLDKKILKRKEVISKLINFRLTKKDAKRILKEMEKENILLIKRRNIHRKL